MKLGLAAQTDKQWAAFAPQVPCAKCRRRPPSQSLDVLAALSHHANFSDGLLLRKRGTAATVHCCARCCLKEARNWSS